MGLTSICSNLLHMEGMTGSVKPTALCTCPPLQLPQNSRAKRKLTGPKMNTSMNIQCAASAVDVATTAPTQPREALPQDKVFSKDDFDNFLRGYKSQCNEHDFWISDDMIEGEIPQELEGTLLRNGPGLFEVGGVAISQPLDGDGMVCSFSFKNGKVFFRNRFVRSEAFIKEQQAQKMLYRGAFSVGNPSGGLFFNPFDFTVKGIANTSVLHWGGKLLALYERDLPYELDTTLRTLGTTDLGGSINTPKKFFGAHHRIVPGPDGGRRLVGFNFSEEPSGGLLNFFEYDEQFRLLYKTTRLLKGATFGFFHDILVTDNYYIALENPISMDFVKLLTKYTFGRACLAECLTFDDRPTRIHIIPRPGCTSSNGVPQKDYVLETDPFFSFHHVNAYEVEGTPQIVVDTAAMDAGIDFSLSMENGSEAMYQRLSGRAVLTRLVCDLSTGKVKKLPLVPDRAAELPTVSPAVCGTPHQHFYAAASRVVGPPNWGAFQMVLKVTTPTDWGVGSSTGSADTSAVKQESWYPGRDSFAQEPIFVPRKYADSEDDGWVLAMVYRAATNTTDLAILDAQHLSRGPVALIHLPHHIPHGIHGSFTSVYLGPRTEEEGKVSTYDIRLGVVDEQGQPKYS
ncbi:g1980 [Coccomyxa elongata]